MPNLSNFEAAYLKNLCFYFHQISTTDSSFEGLHTYSIFDIFEYTPCLSSYLTRDGNDFSRTAP